jgi:hypothetical protein
MSLPWDLSGKEILSTADRGPAEGFRSRVIPVSGAAPAQGLFIDAAPTVPEKSGLA